MEYSFVVNWSTTAVVSPRLEITCYEVQPRSVVGESGSLAYSITQKIDMYPGLLHQKCWARFSAITALEAHGGETEVAILVGDPSGATQRAIKRKTDDENAIVDLTAEEQARLDAKRQKDAEALKAKLIQDAVATEVYGTQTAEFKLTADKAETARAKPSDTPIPISTMNGTFTINWSHGYYTSGFIKLKMNSLSGQVDGSIDGTGSYEGDETCQDGRVEHYTNIRKFSGDLVGTVDISTGMLSLRTTPESMTGTISTSGGCTEPMTMGLHPSLTLVGTVNLQNHTAKGQILSTHDYDPGQGDWDAR